MKEKLQEIYEGLKERLKSPFLLSFIVVWSIHNWEFVYALLTFNSDFSYIKRVSYLKAYLIVHDYDVLLWIPLCWTFASIAIYFIASFFSEGISLVYSKWVRTWLYWAIDRNKLKTEDDYNELDERRKNLQELVFDLRRKEEDAALKLKRTEELFNKTIDEERKELAKYLNQNTEKEKAIFDKNKELEMYKDDNSRFITELEKTKQEMVRIKKQQDELFAFKSWTDKNHPNLFDKWQNRTTDDKFEKLLTGKSNLNIGAVFSGEWILTYTKEGKSNSENVIFRDTNKYFSNGNHAFFIQDVHIDYKSRKITFSKVRLDRKLHAKEELTIQGSDLITGVDSLGYNLEYKRK